MSNFQAKHEELYIEELKVLFQEYATDPSWTLSNKISNIFDEMDFNKKNNIIEVLKILNDLTDIKEINNWLNYVNPNMYKPVSLKDKIFEAFREEIIELILIQEEQNNE